MMINHQSYPMRPLPRLRTLLFITLLCFQLSQGVYVDIRHLDDEATAAVPSPTSEHKRHGYHRSELIGAWIVMTVVPLACIVFFCATAPRVRQRELLFKLFHRDGVYTQPSMVEMEDLEAGPTTQGPPRQSSWWDRLWGRSRAAAQAGTGMAATVIGKAKPVIKTAARKIDRSRVGRHHRKQRQRGFRQLDHALDDDDYVKYSVYADEEDEATFGGLDGPSSLSSWSSSSWTSSPSNSPRDGSPQLSSSSPPTVIVEPPAMDLIGYYDYQAQDGQIHQEFREEVILTTIEGVQGTSEEETTVRRVSFHETPPMEEEEGPQITEVTDDNKDPSNCDTTTMTVEEPPDESPTRVKASSAFSESSRRTSEVISSDDEGRYMSATESNCYQSCSDGSSSDDEEEDDEEGVVDAGDSSFTTETSDVITGGASNSSSNDDHHHGTTDHDT